jgi:hypothetical protein
MGGLDEVTAGRVHLGRRGAGDRRGGGKRGGRGRRKGLCVVVRKEGGLAGAATPGMSLVTCLAATALHPAATD